MNRQGQERSENFAELDRAEAIAQTKGLGIWCKDEEIVNQAVREMPGECMFSRILADAPIPSHLCCTVSAADFFHEMGKGEVVSGIVDQVLNGSLLRVILLPKFYSVLISVAGVQAPSLNKRGPDGEQGPEPYAPQAKHFTECRVLNRDVRLVLQGLDRYENLFAQVLWQLDGHECDLGKELLRSSFAKTAEWSLTMMAGNAQEMHALEREAKEAKKNIWTNYVAQASNSDKLTEKFSGTIVEVTSGDCLTVLDANANVERRIQLSR